MARISRKANTAPDVHKRVLWNLAMYVRLSVQDNGLIGRDSVNNQLELIQNFVPKITDVSECYTYIDNGNTGTDFERMQWEQLMSDVRTKKVNCIIVKDLSRFARNYIEAGDYLEKIFPFLGVRFIAVNDCYDSAGILFEENGLTISLKNLINDYYSRDISKKIISSFSSKISNGEYIGSKAPYGYILQDGHFVVDPVAADIVKRIFSMYLDGNSGYRIAELLNEENISSPSKYAGEQGIKKYKDSHNVKWQGQTIMRILNDETYTGKLIVGKVNASKYRNENKGLRKKRDWKDIPNAHDAIIAEEAYQLVQYCLEKNRADRMKNLNRKKENTSENILKGVIYCGICGRPLTRNSTQRRGKAEYAYYCSTGYRRNEAKCTTASISEKKLYVALLGSIKAQIQCAVEMDSLMQQLKITANHSDKYLKLCEQIDWNQNEHKRALVHKTSAYEDYKLGELTKEEYIFAKERYDKRIEQLALSLEKSIREKELFEQNLKKQNKWLSMFTEFQGAESISKEMIDSLITRIDMFSGHGLQITFKFKEEFDSITKYLEYTKGGAAGDGEISGRIS